MHPLAALLQSLLPWFRMREAAAADAGGEAPPVRQHPLPAELRDVDEEDVRRQQRRTLEALRGHQGQELQARALAGWAAWPAVPRRVALPCPWAKRSGGTAGILPLMRAFLGTTSGAEQLCRNIIQYAATTLACALLDGGCAATASAACALWPGLRVREQRAGGRAEAHDGDHGADAGRRAPVAAGRLDPPGRR